MEQKSREINGTTYKVTQMDALTALSVQAKLVKILGPAFGEVANGATRETIVKAVAKLTENFDDENVVALIQKLFAKNIFEEVVVEGTPINKPIEFNTYFSGKTLDIWLVTFFILEVNFADVLGKFGLNSIFQEASQKLES